MSNTTGWEELTSENERLIGPHEPHGRYPAGAGDFAQAGGGVLAGAAASGMAAGDMPAAGAAVSHGYGGAADTSSLTTKPASPRTRRWRMSRKSARVG